MKFIIMLLSLTLLFVPVSASTAPVFPTNELKTKLVTDDVDFGIPDYYGGISGTTTKEAFFERVNELPPEMPVIMPREVKGDNIYFVSPDGKDTGNDGSMEKPFKTLETALSAVSRQKENGKSTVIYLREGIYQIKDTIYIDSGVSGTDKEPLFISAYKDEEVTFTGGTGISGDKFLPIKDQSKLNRLFPNVRDKVLVCDLPALGITDYGEISWHTEDAQVSLYLDNEMMTLSRWPNRGGVTYHEVIDRGPITLYDQEQDDGRGMEFVFEGSRPLNWLNTGELGMRGSWFEEWLKSMLQIKEINESTRSIRTVNSIGYGAKVREANEYFYFNIFEELDTPGEWYLDREDGKLYFYPPMDISEKTLTLLARKSDLMHIRSLKNIVINGISFESGMGSGIIIDRGYKNVIQNCLIKNFGAYGVYFDDCHKSGVTSSVITKTENYAVQFTGSENSFKNLIPSRNFLQNSFIYGDSEDSILNGIMLRTTVGAIISHNLIQNINAACVMVDGIECIIEYNEMVGGPRTVADCSFVYLGGGAPNRGTHLRYNYMHENSLTNTSGAVSVGYFDDLNSDNYAYGNILYKIPKGFYSHNGKDIVLYNNIIMESVSHDPSAITDSLNYYSMDLSQWQLTVSNPWSFQGSIIRGIIDPYSDVWSRRFPSLVRYRNSSYDLEDIIYKEGYVKEETGFDMRSPSGHYFADNLIVNHGKLSISEVARKTLEGLETNVQTNEDPGFTDMKNKDFSFKPDAWVYKKIPEFKEPPFYKMGILSSDKKEMGDMWCIVPEDKSAGTVIHEAVNFKWASSQFASFYTLEVATDPEFKNIVETKVTEFSHAELSLSGIGQTYYWRLTAETLARGIEAEPVVSDVWSFTTMNQKEIELYAVPEIEPLTEAIERAREMADDLIEGTEDGTYKSGTIDKLLIEIEKAEKGLKAVRLASDVKKATDGLKNAMSYSLKQINTTERTISIDNFAAEMWASSRDDLRKQLSDNILSFTPTGGSAFVTYENKLSYSDIVKFAVNVENLNQWMVIAKETVPYTFPVDQNATDSYSIIIKPDFIELQKYEGKEFRGILGSVANNLEIISSNKWHDVEFGTVCTENGVKITLSVDGVQLFDYLDSDNPILSEGYLSIYLNDANKRVMVRQ